MMNDVMNLLFRAGIPYDAERNEFRVGLQDIPRIERQRDLIEQEERWMSSSRSYNPWIDYDND